MTANWLTQQSRDRGNSPSLIFENKVWTFAELETASVRVAKSLIQSGIFQRMGIAVLADNSPELVILIHALVKLNCVSIPLNTRLSVQELQWQLDDAKTSFLIFNLGKLEIVNQLKVNNLSLINLEGLVTEYSDADKELESHHFDLDAVQTIIYTSGTTGLPKGVQLTYRNHFASAIASATHLEIDHDCDRWLNCMPLFHIGGLSIIWRSVIWGMTMVLLPKFDVSEVCQAIATQEITFISLVPTMLVRILSSSDFQNTLSAWQNLRGILLGGASTSSELLSQALEYQLPIMPTYGLTEAASQVTTLLPKDISLKFGSSGQALSCNQLLIVSLEDDGLEVEVGAIGQILIKGENVMKNYRNQNLGENCLNTGDLGYLDHQEYLYVVNRRSDLIISGGENIYPAEIESILLKHPQIQAACVIGIVDQEWGQVVAAVLEITNSEINLVEVRDFCLNAGLSKYKLPQKLCIVDAIPITPNGKVSRELVRKLMLF
jgi:o-succinylbenzoate---CoA ligase